MLRIAVCDDDQKFCGDLAELLRENTPAGERSIVEEYYTGEQLVYSYLEKRKAYDLVILDIEMPLMDGMEAGTKIRAIDDEVKIIFLTNYAAYSLPAYEVRPYHYLLKPVNENKIIGLCRDIHNEKRRSYKEYLDLEIPGGFLHVPYSQIRYLESDRQRLNLHLIKRTVTIYKKLSDMASLLDERFVQSHKSFIVNLDHIEDISERYTTIRLVGCDTPIPISRRMKDGFMEQLKEYIYGNKLL